MPPYRRHPVRWATRFSLIVALVWMVGMTALDRTSSGRFAWFNLFDDTVGGLAVGVLVWVLLRTMDRRQRLMAERTATMRALTHHIANPVQVLMNREHLPADKRERLVDKAVQELNLVCLELLPKLGIEQPNNAERQAAWTSRVPLR